MQVLEEELLGLFVSRRSGFPVFISVLEILACSGSLPVLMNRNRRRVTLWNCGAAGQHTNGHLRFDEAITSIQTFPSPFTGSKERQLCALPSCVSCLYNLGSLTALQHGASELSANRTQNLKACKQSVFGICSALSRDPDRSSFS